VTPVRVPEKNKKPGVCYAATGDGIELPVIDITHPAFATYMSETEIVAVIENTVRQFEASRTRPPEVTRALIESSLLARGWAEAAGTFMTGMMTYLNRLGPQNLGDGYANAVDRAVAAGIAPLSFRFRLQHVARLLADGLGAALTARPGAAVHLLNIGGGTAIDSLNALILLRQEHPEWLAGRPVAIQVLDQDREAPAFGARALAALTAAGAPLDALAATLRHVPYDWSDPADLRAVIELIGPKAAVAVSSEGALFDYGTDEQIVANLSSLAQGAPADCVIAGSVVRDEQSQDPRLLAFAVRKPSIRFLGLDAFRALACRAGWRVERSLDSVSHHAVLLKR
jgi:hypothetical protein